MGIREEPKHLHGGKLYPVPAFYVCNRCKKGGHHVMKCPTNEDPHFDVRPAMGYICMFCEKNGDHYRMFCPKNPAPDSIYRRRLAKGLRATADFTRLVSDDVDDAKFTLIGDGGSQKRSHSDCEASIDFENQATLLDQEKLNETSIRRSPSLEEIDDGRDRKILRQTRKSKKHINNPSTPSDRRQPDLLGRLFCNAVNISVIKRPDRPTALDFWDINDIRKLRQERQGDDQSLVPFQEDLDRYLQAKAVKEQGHEAWEAALEDLIGEACEQIHASKSEEVEAQIARERLTRYEFRTRFDSCW
ncbi:MAG: hypothetical protein M1818_003490 [Claussenomyces sp. TS43310]|nr:MAG: hypothetical protein M1818_003490 [Claussenomyces sp. TS43310]